MALSGMILYYGRHYFATFRSNKLKRWLLLNDKKVTVLGTWKDVISRCRLGKWQPTVLFYQSLSVKHVSSVSLAYTMLPSQAMAKPKDKDHKEKTTNHHHHHHDHHHDHHDHHHDHDHHATPSSPPLPTELTETKHGGNTNDKTEKKGQEPAKNTLKFRPKGGVSVSVLLGSQMFIETQLTQNLRSPIVDDHAEKDRKDNDYQQHHHRHHHRHHDDDDDDDKDDDNDDRWTCRSCNRTWDEHIEDKVCPMCDFKNALMDPEEKGDVKVKGG
eukprot:CAMPEP_0167805544 /NCGR_PEP_ID=MMETSP0111_2-20121227/21245_1 /TAXON_ID=91324 /ORGANISM="Lotharella globosa, Strain CCCM811" /LENGTH=270 /DNA_ID=CAMNT_0007702725 /DNA_START=275 /DNA_END=1083 /DNA_ORIENTATION=+